MSRQQFVGLGRISGTYGVRGWVKIFSYTQPRERILEYSTWHLAADEPPAAEPAAATHLESGRRHGKGIVAKLAGIEDRDAAVALIGSGIYVPREALPHAAPGEYYWADLEGLEVCDTHGMSLGVVDHLLETGAHDVMVLAGDANRLIPFVPETVVVRVDLERGVITVDWDEAWWE